MYADLRFADKNVSCIVHRKPRYQAFVVQTVEVVYSVCFRGNKVGAEKLAVRPNIRIFGNYHLYRMGLDKKLIVKVCGLIVPIVAVFEKGVLRKLGASQPYVVQHRAVLKSPALCHFCGGVVVTKNFKHICHVVLAAVEAVVFNALFIKYNINLVETEFFRKLFLRVLDVSRFVHLQLFPCEIPHAGGQEHQRGKNHHQYNRVNMSFLFWFLGLFFF